MTSRPHREAHPRDTHLTLYGRKPVLEVLSMEGVEVAKLFVAERARGAIIEEILQAAAQRGVPVVRCSAERVSRISRRPKQDQGVAVDVRAPRMRSMAELLAEVGPRARLLALDGVTTPANVGMILRSATVLGLDGVIVPRRGVPAIGPLVIKASAGVAIRAPIVRAETLEDALSDAKLAGFAVYGLSDRGARPLEDVAVRERAIFVLGNETDGVREVTVPLVDEWVRIHMAGTNDSLNVAAAAAIVAFVLRHSRPSNTSG